MDNLTYMAIMTSVVVFLLLILIALFEIRLIKMNKKLDEISKNAQEFVRLGLSYFKSSNKK